MRVATYNVLHGISVLDGRVDLGAVADTLARLDCDAVAVQEVDRALPRTGRVDQVAELADRLGWHGVFAPALLGDPDRSWREVPVDDPGGPAFGVGLLARLPLSGVRRVALPGGGRLGRKRGRRTRGSLSRADSAVAPPRPPVTRLPWWPGWDREPRVALSAGFATGHGTVRLLCTHLSYLPWRGIVQLRAAAGSVAGDRAILLGDLNLPAWPVRLALRRSWTHAGGRPTYPSWRPRVQTDHVLVSGGLAVHGVEVGPRGTSDHLPVVATVTGWSG